MDAQAQTEHTDGVARAGSGDIRAALSELLAQHGALRLARVMDEWWAETGVACSAEQAQERGCLEGVYTHTVTRERVFTCPLFALEDTLCEAGDAAPMFDMKQIEALMHECDVLSIGCGV